MEISKEDREYLFDEFEHKFIKKIDWLFERENIDGVFPILLVMYSYKKRLGIDFTQDGIEGYERGKDDILDGLYDASSAFFGGDETGFRRLVDINDCLHSITKKMFDWYYPFLVDKVLSRPGTLSSGPLDGNALMPNMRIARTIANVLKEHGCESVYTLFSGIGVYSRAFKGLQFTGAEPYAPAILISRVLNDAHHIRSSKYLNVNPLDSWPRKGYDAIVSNIPVDVDFFEERRFHMFSKKYDEMQVAFFRKVLDKGKAKKVVAGLISFDVANYGEYDNIRKEICDRGLLESVMALPEEIFGNAAKTYIVVLDMAGGRDSATFMDATQSLRRQLSLYSDYDVRDSVKDGEKTTVAYSVMEKANWSFNPAVYIQNAECTEGLELVRLGDLVSIPKGRVKGRRTVSKAFFSERFAKVALGTTPVDVSNNYDEIPIEGPSLMMALTAGTRSSDLKLHCAICKDTGQYATESFVSVLQPDPNKISLEYLALALMNDKSFTDYYKKIQAYYVDGVRSSHLLERRIPILTDLAAQKKAASAAIGHADMVDTLYNVLLAGSGKSVSKMKNTLSKFGCCVLKTAEHVEGNGGVEDLLESSRKAGVPVSKRIDAVVFNADIALGSGNDDQPYLGLDAMIDLQLVYGKEIPFYAFSTGGIEDIREAGIISGRRLKYFEKGHLFKNEEGDLPTLLVSSLREELESFTSIDTKIRSQYREAFEAAEWLDAAYPESDIHSVEVISDFLLATTRPGEDTTRKISDMRIVAHRIIEILRKCRAVPTELDNGAVPKLLYYNKFKNDAKGVIYVQRVEIMPKTLSASLISLVDIGNEGAHTFSSRPNLAMSMAQILMEFIQWFYAKRDTFSGELSGYWTDGNDYETHWDEIVGIAKCKLIGGENIWFCNDIHLFVHRSKKKRTNIREGDRIVIRKRQKQTKDELIREGLNWIAYPKDNGQNTDGYTIEYSQE